MPIKRYQKISNLSNYYSPIKIPHSEMEKEKHYKLFLMYAKDELHKMNVYVSADVFGESSWGYVTAYGQYFPAISNVVDAISAMPYTDHYEASNGYYPWEHPYEKREYIRRRDRLSELP